MTKYRIIAYFMHEHEQEAAKKAVDAEVITGAEWTPGFVMGVVDEFSIEPLSKQGLVISFVEKIVSTDEETALRKSQLNAPLGRTANAQRALTVSIEKQTPNRKIRSKVLPRTDFYVVRFHGPITEERRKELRKLHINLVERVTRNKYTVQLKPSQVKTLAKLPSVDWIRVYTEADTLRVQEVGNVTQASSSAVKPRASTAQRVNRSASTQRTCVYTIKLHQKKDMPAVVKWLARRKRKPLWKRGDQLQVALVQNSKTLTDLAKRPEVAIVEQIEAPRLYDKPARTLVGLVRKNIKLGLEGAGEIIGIADTGIDMMHVDLVHRIEGVSAWGRPGKVSNSGGHGTHVTWGRPGKISDPEGHGTHVAGCAVGDGTASQGEVLGAAPQAKVFFQSILDDNGGLGGLPDDLGDLLKEAYDNGARIHNNSWGAFSFAHYANTSLHVDRFVAAKPDMLVVIAAGNDGIGVPRVVGAKMSAAQGFVDWPCVAAPATSKNGLTVGASRNSRTTGGYAELTWGEAWPNYYPHPPIMQERISGDDQSLAAFSGRGPADNDQIKPDVVAPGTDIAAAKSKDAPLHKFWGAYPKSNQYAFMGGTSMAAPYVAGCAALVREWYSKQGMWATPSAALVKATLINGTQRITGIDAVAELLGDPNFHQGFGRIDMSNTIPSPLSPNLKLVFDDTGKNNGRIFSKEGRLRYRVKVGNGLPLRLCLAWTDPAARAVQNSLKLIVDNASETKWVGNAQAAMRRNPAGEIGDPNNNVQVARIENPQPGDYTIAVFASMLLFPPQSFALVVTGDLQSALTPLD